MHLFVLLIISHPIEGLLEAFNIDFESLQCLCSTGFAALWLNMQLNTLLFEESSQGCLSNLRIVGLAVGSQTSLHIDLIVVGT
jgi:hypothetical protein